ncbi:MAG: TIGR00180 family glycosyltransferase [Neptuniibacter sp.]
MNLDISILVPTHNRRDRLERLLDYLSAFSIDVVVVDSSFEAFSGNYNQRVKYFHRPDLNFKQKVVFGGEFVSTDYVFLSADDDFPVVDKIVALLKEMNKEFSLLVGTVGVFDEEFDGNFYLQKSAALPGKYSSGNVDWFMSNYSQVLWGVYDRGAMIEAFRIIDDSSFLNDNFIELTLAPFMAGQKGLIKIEDVVYVREFTKKDHWGGRHISLRETYLNDKESFLLDFAAYSKIFGAKLAACSMSAYLTKGNEAQSPLKCLVDVIKHKAPLLMRVGLRLIRQKKSPLVKCDASLSAISLVINSHKRN